MQKTSTIKTLFFKKKNQLKQALEVGKNSRALGLTELTLQNVVENDLQIRCNLHQYSNDKLSQN